MSPPSQVRRRPSPDPCPEGAWRTYPAAERVFATYLDALLDRAPTIRALEARLLDEAGVRLRDIVDHLLVEEDARDAFEQAGWTDKNGVVRLEGALLPPVRFGPERGLALRVERVEAFATSNPFNLSYAGPPLAPVRTGWGAVDGLSFGIVERNGGTGFDAEPADSASLAHAEIFLQRFRSRPRNFDDPRDGLLHARALVAAAVDTLGPHWSCALWLTAERDFWMSRCTAGRIQKARQDRVGIGWSNIDHHTYDSSRALFPALVDILELLGYERREMLYAGHLAGWGSQILEHPTLGSTIFADIDLLPEELDVDFAREPLSPLARHRRAGLLTALHGESILEGGLNHVAALFDQRRLRAQLRALGIEMMVPFSDFPFLYQELTVGERASVPAERVRAAVARGDIGACDAAAIAADGAVLTHLENIERNLGYKGFNKPGIDGVLRLLDPRADAAVP